MILPTPATPFPATMVLPTPIACYITMVLNPSPSLASSIMLQELSYVLQVVQYLSYDRYWAT